MKQTTNKGKYNVSFDELPKWKRLLVFMYTKENANEGCATSMPDSVDEIISLGITKNKKSLSSMLYDLQAKNLIKCNFKGYYYLTQDGIDIANACQDEIDDEVCSTFGIPKSNITNEQPQIYANTAMKSAFESMATSFDAMSKAFASMAKTFKTLQIAPNRHVRTRQDKAASSQED